MRQWCALVCLLLGMALAQEGSAPSLYPSAIRSGLPYFRPEMWLSGKLPYVTVTRDDLFEKALKAQKDEPIPTYEWQLPLSSYIATRITSQKLRAAWQRLEERTYWRAMTELNLPVTLVPCTTGLWNASFLHGKINPPLPEVKVGAVKEFFPEQYKLPLSEVGAASAGMLRMDTYSYFYLGIPQVPGSDFCDDFGLKSPIDLLPVIIHGVCLKAIVNICTPGYPDPFLVFPDLAHQRVTRALEHATKKYVPQYEKDVLAAVQPRLNSTLTDRNVEPDIFAPTDWSGALLGAGALVTPVARFVATPDVVVKDFKEIVDTLRKARFSDEKLDKAVWVYYSNAIYGFANRNGIPLAQLGIDNQLLNTAQQTLSLLQGSALRNSDFRGIWPLEEIKRFFPVATPQLQEALGFVNYYQVFARFDLTPLPDPKASWQPGEYATTAAMRSVHMWHVPLSCTPSLTPPFVLCVPDAVNVRPWPLPPYSLFLSAPRYYWDWVSIPDGYPIPRVRGVPLSPPVVR